MFKFMRKNKAEKKDLPNTPVEVPVVEEEDSQLIAVIAAAVSSFLGKPVGGFRIRSIKRASNWNK